MVSWRGRKARRRAGTGGLQAGYSRASLLAMHSLVHSFIHCQQRASNWCGDKFKAFKDMASAPFEFRRLDGKLAGAPLPLLIYFRAQFWFVVTKLKLLLATTTSAALGQSLILNKQLVISIHGIAFLYEILERPFALYKRYLVCPLAYACNQSVFFNSNKSFDSFG